VQRVLEQGPAALVQCCGHLEILTSLTLVYSFGAMQRIAFVWKKFET
jgi:hypothetical protein